MSMDIPHRFNTRERQHFLLKSRYSFRIKPRILYVGRLAKNGGWKEDVHCHSFCEIIYISDGRGWVKIRTEERTGYIRMDYAVTE